MEFLWRMLAAFSFDCFRDSASSSRFPSKPGSSTMDSSSLTGSLSLGPDFLLPAHCQCCVTYQARLKRLSCGHLFCGPCCHQIVDLAFQDIEGLSDYPCPVCKEERGRSHD